MEVNYAVICEAASVDAQGRIDINKAFDKLTAPGFPFLLADKFCVVVNYSAGPAEYTLSSTSASPCSGPTAKWLVPWRKTGLLTGRPRLAAEPR